MVQANKVVEKRLCKDCNVMSIAMWYTKRGRVNVMCMKCGKTWDVRANDYE